MDNKLDYPLELEDVINKLSRDQLIHLNRYLVDRINAFQELDLLKAKSKFLVGDRVKFEYEGTSYFGRVTKKNKKTVSVHTDDHKDWNISPNLLSKLHPASQ